MKRVKKILALLLTAILVFSLAACSKEKTTSNEDNNSNDAGVTSAVADPTTAADATSGEKVKITYAIWGTAEEQATTQKVADVFNASQDKIEVTITAIPNENYATVLNTMATAKELPDCGMVREDMVIPWTINGMLADISSMYDGADSKPMENTAYKYEGKTVAYAVANEELVLYYNKDMFDKAGVAYPPTSIDNAWTWDEFVAAAKKLTIDSNGKHPDEDGFNPDTITQYGCMVENFIWQLEEYCLTNGGGFYNKDGTEVAIGEDASIEGIQKVADLYLKDHVAPLSVGQTDDGCGRSIIAGTVAMTTNGTWNVGTSLNAAKADGLNYGIAVLPYMKNKVTLTTAGANAVFSQGGHQKEAMEWVKWYSSEENGWSLISQGIWMPLLEKWYTDDTLTHKWLDNPNFPAYDDYKSAVVDNALSPYIQNAGWFYTNNTGDFNTLLSSILGDVWTGKTTAKEAITANLDALKAAHEGE